ncbi:hypothetical protein SARC_03268 [Sphaeroforma arctica JP610]|uniref:Uncharacterized protein n=1 Tax=Sphaeroforma arctica JP610 TaxID=667725 RepID=A0A0L0G684_9EUKA|nr:hypothetical protein SARC_03268 [Sphaeroforma arctica JP610]KNC84522.1 hypothetical protein SARC_03268 [Sphaeroforma arctica JP610]|eukprot:XP_014158424.1 hypothetical protein SARC_03268 [Sphaeroforma arctica JP610]
MATTIPYRIPYNEILNDITFANNHIFLLRTILAAVTDTVDDPFASDIAIYLSAHAAFLSELDTITAVIDRNNRYQATSNAQADLARVRRDRTNIANKRDAIHAEIDAQSIKIAAPTANHERIRHYRNTIITDPNAATAARDIARADCDLHTIEHESLMADLDRIRNERDALIIKCGQARSHCNICALKRDSLLTI